MVVKLVVATAVMIYCSNGQFDWYMRMIEIKLKWCVYVDVASLSWCMIMRDKNEKKFCIRLLQLSWLSIGYLNSLQSLLSHLLFKNWLFELPVPIGEFQSV